MLETILVAICSQLAVDGAKAAIRKAYTQIVCAKPNLAKNAEDAKHTGNVAEIERIFNEIISVAASEAKRENIEQGAIRELSEVKFDEVIRSLRVQGELKVGDESVVIGNVRGTVGDKSVVVGATDERDNTILTTPMAVGHGARAGPGSIAIGTNARAGRKDSE